MGAVSEAPAFALRPMTPADGPAIAALGEQTPETGAVSLHSRFQFDPYATLVALRPETVGVVAEAPDGTGLAGLGLMSFGECLYEEAIRPYAYLYSLSVHPRYRRRGLASRIAAWRVAVARERNGNEGVTFAGVQPGNVGSLRVAQEWSQQRMDRIKAAIVKARTKPPEARSGREVRPALETELEEIAVRQNAFYNGFNLYPPRTAESLAAWLAHAPLGFRFRDYYVLVDGRRNILAGLEMIDEGRLLSSQIVSVARPLRLANVVIRMIPKDGIVKRLVLEGPWFAAGQPDAATYLWESMRWLARDRASVVMTFFDVRSPVADVIPTPWWIPSTPGALLVAGPVPMRENRLLYMGF